MMKRDWIERSDRALQIDGLSKQYGKKKAVDHVDLTVSSGSFLGLIGPNGAGKTTLLSMTVGLLRLDEGSSSIVGYAIWRDPMPQKNEDRIVCWSTQAMYL